MSGLSCFGCLDADLLLLQDLPQQACTEPYGGHHVSQDGIDFVGSTANVQGPPSCRQAHSSTHQNFCPAHSFINCSCTATTEVISRASRAQVCGGTA